MVKKKVKNVNVKNIDEVPKSDLEKFPTMMIAAERDIALDFATKTYKQFDRSIKAIVYFGSSAKQESKAESDIDLIIIIDDVTILWDEQAIATYREELGKIIRLNPYRKELHVNTVKLSTWWQDLIRGDPVLINVLRYGEALVDYGGFFAPQKVLLQQGKIRSTPESIYTLLQRAPSHMARAKAAMISVVDGFYWACVDSAHAALITANILPPSPEHIAEIMYDNFVKTKMLDSKYVDYYSEVRTLMKDMMHGKITDISGKKLDEIKINTDKFVGEMELLVDKLLSKK